MKINLGVKEIIITILLIIIIGGGFIFIKKIDNLNENYETEQKLSNALSDSIDTYIDVNGDLVSEKLTMQSDISRLMNSNIELTENKRELMEHVIDLNKNYSVISAALINSKLKIDSLLKLVGSYNSDSNFVIFNKSTDPKNFIYNFKVNNIKPFDINTPITLDINNLEFPNKQKISFNWKDNKKEGNPISFNVINSNKYYKVIDVESYIIPQINKEELDPTNWQKFKIWANGKGKVGLSIGVGIGVGYILFK